MKILFATKELGYRGTPRALANYARILHNGNEVLIWGWEEGGETAETLIGEGFSVIVGQDAEEDALRFSPDILNIHRPGLRCDVETHILENFKRIGTRCVETSVFGRVDQSVEKLLDMSLQISRWDLYRWNAWKGRCSVPGILMPYPVDVNSLKRSSDIDRMETRKSWEVEDVGAFVLGRIGKTSWAQLEKPLIRALNAFENLHFVHVGDYCSGGFPVSLKNHPHVHLQPRMRGYEELSRFYSACDALVSMSWNGESFGFVNAEPMACGTPVIALSTPFRDNAQVEMVQHGHGGVVLAAAKELGCAIRMLMTDHAFARRAKGECRELIVSRYSFEVLEPQLRTAFDCLMTDDVQKAVERAESEGKIFSRLDPEEIRSSLKNVLGKYSPLTFPLMRLYHSHIGYLLQSAFAAGVRLMRRRGV